MEYHAFIESVMKLDWIADQETADAMVKAVLGILASRVEKEKARKMIESLPGPFTLDLLRAHQRRIENITFEDYVAEVANQFLVRREQADELVRRVLRLTREAVGPGVFSEFEEGLPSDWIVEIEQV